MKIKDLADEVFKQNRRRARKPENVEKEIDLTEKAERRGHLGRKITIRVRGARQTAKRRGRTRR